MRTIYKVLSLFNLPVHKQALYSEDVPKKIITVFQKEFPNSVETQWYTRLGVFISQFYHNDKYHQVVFRRTGVISRRYTKISIDDIPEQALQNILGTDPAHSILEVMINEMEEGPKYRLTFILGKEQIEGEFDESGNEYKSSK